MRSYLRITAIAFFLVFVLSGYANAHAADIPLNTHAQVYFSPHGVLPQPEMDFMPHELSY